MAPEPLDQWVHSLERRVTSLEELPGRVDALGTQISHVRDEMRAEFSAIRGEFDAVRDEFEAIRGGPRTPDTPSLMSLQREMRGEFASVRGEMRAEFASVRGEMRAEFADIRGEMRAEFEAIRGGPRTPDMPSLLSLHEEIRGLGDMLRDEIRETAERGMSQTRALFEELVSRIELLREGWNPRPDAGGHDR